MADETLIYRINQRRYYAILFAGILLCFILFVVSLCSGNFKTTPSDVINALLYPEQNPQINIIIIKSRLPRLLGSVLVGAALSVSGLTYQELFSNRMASPDILGVSAGAGVGASISIFCGLNFLLTGFFAFVGGILAVFLTLTASRLFGKNRSDTAPLVLSGIVIGGLMNSVLGLFKYLSNDSQLSSITFWLLGGLYNTSYYQLALAAPIVIVGIAALFLSRWKIVMLRAGDTDAYTHGVNAKALRRICIAVTTVITSVSICISGTIGWIGLAIPNLMRLLVQNDGKKLVPLSLVYGIMFTEMCDLLARTITNTEIPIGIITGVLGAVLFILVLFIHTRRGVQ